MFKIFSLVLFLSITISAQTGNFSGVVSKVDEKQLTLLLSTDRSLTFNTNNATKYLENIKLHKWRGGKFFKSTDVCSGLLVKVNARDGQAFEVKFDKRESISKCRVLTSDLNSLRAEDRKVNSNLNYLSMANYKLASQLFETDTNLAEEAKKLKGLSYFTLKFAESTDKTFEEFDTRLNKIMANPTLSSEFVVEFKQGSTFLTDKNKALLEDLRSLNNVVYIKLVGEASPSGSTASNTKLALARVQVVKNHIVDNKIVDFEKIFDYAFGEIQVESVPNKPSVLIQVYVKQ